MTAEEMEARKQTGIPDWNGGNYVWYDDATATSIGSIVVYIYALIFMWSRTTITCFCSGCCRANFARILLRKSHKINLALATAPILFVRTTRNLEYNRHIHSLYMIPLLTYQTFSSVTF